MTEVLKNGTQDIQIDETKIPVRTYLYKPSFLQEGLISEQFKSQLSEEERANKAVISTNIQTQLGEEHIIDMKLIDGLMKEFGFANANVDKITDFTVGGGIYIDCDDEDAVKIIDDWRKETNFDHFLRPTFKDGLSKGVGWMEIAGLGTQQVNQIKCINPNSVYVKRDKFGNVEAINQFIGKSFMRIGVEDIIPLPLENIIQIDINKIGNSAYGQGIIWSAISTINYFLGAQQSMHTLLRRKANSQVHWKLGNSEKDDYPSQGDIDAFGQKLQFMNDTTEYVTGPNAEAKVIDFGNVSDKFTGVMDNDYKMMSYCFQVPETIMGAGNVPEGLADVQKDILMRRCKSYQEDLKTIIKGKIFDKVLAANGKTDVDYKIIFGYLSDEEKNKRLDVYKNLLSANMSAGMKLEIEKKICQELNINFEEVQAENDQAKADQDAQFQQGLASKNPLAFGKESIKESISDRMYLRGAYKHDHICENVTNENIKVSEWLATDTKTSTKKIIEVIEKDEFENLKAKNAAERREGYLSKRQVDKLRKIFKEGVEKDLSIKDIRNSIRENINVGDIKRNGKVVLHSADRVDLIAKTELTRLLNKGLSEAYGDYGDEVVKWNAIIDEKTCPICSDLNNIILDMNTAVFDNMLPPIHPNCRCSIERIKTEDIKTQLTASVKLETVKDIVMRCLKEGKAPQEIEEELVSSKKMTEDMARRFVDNYFGIKDTSDDKIDEYVRKVGSKWGVFSHKSGKRLGTYDSKEEAEKALKRMAMFKHKKENVEVKKDAEAKV